MWGEAQVTFPDWQGNIQVDQKMTGVTWRELIGLERDGWGIVGIDIGGGEHSHQLSVVAVDMRNYPEDTKYTDVAKQNDGVLPVTEFLIHDVDPYQFLQEMTHHLELRMRPRSVLDLPIQVVAYGDVPEQE